MYTKHRYVEPSEAEITEILNGRFFQNRGIKNFSEDFSGWLLIPKINRAVFNLFQELSSDLLDYDFSQINEDLFSKVYQEIVQRQQRHKAGEYYTPEWLVELILNEAFAIWEKQNDGRLPKILDPACGSGSFILQAIKIFKNEKCSLTEIVSSIQGFDVNPIAGFIARANYISAIDDLIDAEDEIEIPIYVKDSLKSPDLFEDSAKLNKYDILIGNPPWVVMRSLKSKGYQQFLKREILKYGLLERQDVHLFTQMELATLLFCKSADLYLDNGGIVAYVMPRSVLAGTKHHVNFRKFETPLIKLLKIIDLDGVNPLFNVPACVLIGLKGDKTRYPVLVDQYSGKLNQSENEINNAKRRLVVKVSNYSPPNFSVKASYYYDKFKVGASIFPRSLYFVDLISMASDSDKILVQTSDEILQIVKDPWQVIFKGEIDRKFLYATLLAWEIFPFGFSRLRPVILPIKENSMGYELIDIDKLEKDGDDQSARWFRNAQLIWNEKRTKNSEQRFPSLTDRLNYNGLLTIQNNHARYNVVYNATGTNLVACVIDRSNLPSFEVDQLKLIPMGLILDVKTWFFATQNLEEANYLSAILNSAIISKLIKPLQPNGLFGARAIHRRPFLLRIPKFNSKDESHLRLADIAMMCQEKVETIKFNQTNRIRAEARRLVKDEIKEIDSIVESILSKSTAEE
ncbi:MAG: SAM-dependent methyltransferase [candidate division KSB1 bacterium]|nr:SAM-dependent methyltransferase [candidate division KSB1 bacterium]